MAFPTHPDDIVDWPVVVVDSVYFPANLGEPDVKKITEYIFGAQFRGNNGHCMTRFGVIFQGLDQRLHERWVENAIHSEDNMRRF